MKRIMTSFVVGLICMSLVGCSPTVSGYPTSNNIQRGGVSLTAKSLKSTKKTKTSTPKLESNSALVTTDGKTELFYLTNAKFSTDYYRVGKGKDGVNVYRDKFDNITFYSYDSKGQVEKSLSFRLKTVGGRAEKGKIQTQDDVTKTGEGRNGSVHLTFSTVTGVWSEDDDTLFENQNDYAIEIVEVIEPEKTYHIRGTFMPHANSTVGSNIKNNEKIKDVKFDALFTIGEVHPVADSHGDAGNTYSAYKIRMDEGSSGSSGGGSSGGSGSGSSGGKSGQSNGSKDTNPYNTKHVCGGCKGKKVLTCPVCYGLKTCRTCYGDKYSYGMKCMPCDGKGVCKNCRGKGEVKCTTCTGKGYCY